MATYRSIAAGETDAESPVTQELMDALALNPTAITEGAAGAPRVQILAMGEALAAGTTIRISEPGPFSTTGATVQTVDQILFSQTGTVRFEANHRTDNSSFQSTLNFFINGSLAATWSTNSLSNVRRQLDFSITHGTRILVQHNCSSTGTSTVDTIQYGTTGGRIIPWFPYKVIW